MPIRDPAEDERTDYRSYDVERRNCAEIGAGKMERLGALQGGTERTNNSDFEPVENPCDSQTYDDQGVKPTPGSRSRRNGMLVRIMGDCRLSVIRITFDLSGRVDSRNGGRHRVTTRWRRRGSTACRCRNQRGGLVGSCGRIKPYSPTAGRVKIKQSATRSLRPSRPCLQNYRSVQRSCRTRACTG